MCLRHCHGSDCYLGPSWSSRGAVPLQFSVASAERGREVTDALTLIATLLRAAQIAGNSFADAMGSHNATARQMQVLAAIAAADRPQQAQICELTGTDRSTLSMICRRLAQKRWIARRRAPRDARAYVMTVTPEGHAVLACALAAAERAVSHISPSIAGVDQLRCIGRPQDMAKRARHTRASAARIEGTGAQRSIPRQLEVLAAIAASKDLCQRDLSDMMDVDHSTISIICKGLAESGWIKRLRSPEDTRAYMMAVTSKGRAVLASAGVIGDRAMARNG